MKFEMTLKRRFRKPITIVHSDEDEMWALYSINYKYPKHKLISINQIK